MSRLSFGRRRGWVDRLGVAGLLCVATISLVLLLAPSLIVIAISFEPHAFITFPPSGIAIKWYMAIAQNEQILDSIGVSLRTAALVMVISLLLGVPAAFACVRGRFPGRSMINAILLSPQMMPGMVIGIATLFFGAYFAFYQSNLMLTLSLGVFCLPLIIRIVMARLAGLDPILDEASANLGAGSLATFCRITLPQMWTAVIAAAAFVFIEAFDNVTIALFTSDVRRRPLSVELYYLVQYDSTPMIAAISALEIGLSLLVMLLLAQTIGLDRLGVQSS